jgi:hypothetical protein
MTHIPFDTHLARSDCCSVSIFPRKASRRCGPPSFCKYHHKVIIADGLEVPQRVYHTLSIDDIFPSIRPLICKYRSQESFTEVRNSPSFVNISHHHPIVDGLGNVSRRVYVPYDPSTEHALLSIWPLICTYISFPGTRFTHFFRSNHWFVNIYIFQDKAFHACAELCKHHVVDG